MGSCLHPRSGTRLKCNVSIAHTDAHLYMEKIWSKEEMNHCNKTKDIGSIVKNCTDYLSHFFISAGRAMARTLIFLCKTIIFLLAG